MQKESIWLDSRFVDMHFVDEEYHQKHAQMLHCHKDVLELLYIQQGSGSYVVNGHTYFIKPGDLVVCNADVLHGEVHSSQHTIQSYCCVLNDIQVPGLPQNTLIQEQTKPVLSVSLSNTAPVEYMMLALYELNTSANREVCQSLSNTLLNFIYRSLNSRKEECERPSAEELIQNITLYLDQHYTESVSLEELGEVFHLSHFYVSHIFKDATGLPPMKYVTQRRIGEAQNLLMNTNLAIGQIGDQLGFSDNCHFSSVFKRYIGITPTQYRNHFQTSQRQ